MACTFKGLAAATLIAASYTFNALFCCCRWTTMVALGAGYFLSKTCRMRWKGDQLHLRHASAIRQTASNIDVEIFSMLNGCCVATKLGLQAHHIILDCHIRAASVAEPLSRGCPCAAPAATPCSHRSGSHP